MTLLVTRLVAALKTSAETVKKLGPDWQRSRERKEWIEQADRALGFLLDNMEEKHCILGINLAISVMKLPLDTQKMTSFYRYAERFKDIMMAGRYR